MALLNPVEESMMTFLRDFWQLSVEVTAKKMRKTADRVALHASPVWLGAGSPTPFSSLYEIKQCGAPLGGATSAHFPSRLYLAVVMEALTRLDEALIDAAEKALLAGRTKLGLSFPQAISFCASMTIVMLASSVFLSSGNLLTVKVPLLGLYAVLAFTVGKTLFRDLAYFDGNWNSEAERGFAKNATENRVKLRPARAILWAFAVMSVLFTSTLSLRLLELDAISPLNAGRDILSSLLGIPVLLIYLYVMCARPSGRVTL